MLCDFLKLTYQDRDNPNFEDLLYISIPAVEGGGDGYGYEDAEVHLVTAIRNVALQMVRSNPADLKKILVDFETRKWAIFRRLNMYLLSELPEQEPDAVTKYLTDVGIFDNDCFEHEYALLIRKGFKFLDSDEKNKILKWIEDAESINERIASASEKLDTATAEKIKEGWQRDKLSYINDSLPDKWKARFLSLVSKHGEPDHPDLPHRVVSFTGPTSDISAQDILKMDTPTLISNLQTWEPKSDRYGFGSTKEGLGRELTAAIKQEPERFNDAAEQFQGLDATYARAYLQAFDELVRNRKNINWEPILTLCEWIVKQPRDIPGRKGGIIDQDPHWGWARRTIASLISTGVNQSLIPYGLRKKVWAILEPITTDPSPTPEDEKTREGNLIDDPYGLAINTARGEAMGAVIEYALWVYRGLEKTEQGKEITKQGFAEMPEVQQVLEYHLDPNKDPSIAVRSVYGRFFPWILLIDRSWTLAHIQTIFPAGEFTNPLYAAAWNSYLLHVQAFNDPMKVLAAQYKEALSHLGEVKQTSRTDRDKRLVQQLMLFYWRGVLTSSDDLFVLFWKSAPPIYRGEALDFIGRSIRSEKNELEPDIRERLETLWENRLALAQSAVNKDDFADEMSAFGWWFASGKFDSLWSSEQYLKALEIGTKAQSDYFVAERLVEIVNTLPIQVIRILAKLALSDEPRWFVFGNKDEITKVLSTALNCGEEVVQQEAQELINRLVAKGHVDFGDLLK